MNNICVLCGVKTDKVFSSYYDPGCKVCAPMIHKAAGPRAYYSSYGYEDGFPRWDNNWQKAIAKLKQERIIYPDQKCSICSHPAPHKPLSGGVCEICTHIQSL